MEYLSCDCEHCKNGIEFPAHGVGRRISCPHCGAPVTLKKTEPAPLGEPLPGSRPPPAVPSPGSGKTKADPKAPSKSSPTAQQPQTSSEFEEKARKWRVERIQWLFTEAKASLPLLAQTKMDKAAARKLRDLFEEISDEFERKASEAEMADKSP